MTGACASLEGLDQLGLCAIDCGGVDASVAPQEAGAGDAAGTTGDDASDDAADGATMDRAAASSPDSAGDAGTDATGADAQGDAACTCVPAAPSGWTGFVQIVLSDAGAPQCAAPYAHAQGTKKTAPAGSPASCTPCTCGTPPTGPILCQVSLGSGGAACLGEAMTTAPAGLCVIPPGPMGITSGPNGDSYGPTMFPTPSGTCAPDGGKTAQPPAAPGTTSVAVCAAAAGAAGACPSAGDDCVATPAPKAGSPSGACIYQPGVQTCPAGRFTAQVVVADGVVDTRGCGACACAAPGCPADGYVEGYTTANCSGSPATTFDASAPCVLGDNANLSVSFKYFPSHSPWAGTCAPSGGGPTGGVALDSASATTFCCIP